MNMMINSGHCQHGIPVESCSWCCTFAPNRGPIQPQANIDPAAKIETTWAILQDYQRRIAERDAKIADLILERDALSARLAQVKIFVTAAKE